ncbi:MAG: type II toxin-antitoxin system RelE/ParE family toxin [Candidatus Hatepunaea meridiana]|nr:type II toxin-antitoxin system RelE/ParE family toxin [Candidatus Hatepunaea meridiana]
MKIVYDLDLAPSAERDLDKIPEVTAGRITNRLMKLKENPRPRGSVKLKGRKQLYRIKIGKYRVIYAIEDDILLILVIKEHPRFRRNRAT